MTLEDQVFKSIDQTHNLHQTYARQQEQQVEEVGRIRSNLVYFKKYDHVITSLSQFVEKLEELRRKRNKESFLDRVSFLVRSLDGFEFGYKPINLVSNVEIVFDNCFVLKIKPNHESVLPLFHLPANQAFVSLVGGFFVVCFPHKFDWNLEDRKIPEKIYRGFKFISSENESPIGFSFNDARFVNAENPRPDFKISYTLEVCDGMVSNKGVEAFLLGRDIRDMPGFPG